MLKIAVLEPPPQPTDFPKVYIGYEKNHLISIGTLVCALSGVLNISTHHMGPVDVFG